MQIITFLESIIKILKFIKNENMYAFIRDEKIYFHNIRKASHKFMFLYTFVRFLVC